MKPLTFIAVFMLGAAAPVKNENFYNEKMARCLNGKTEQRINYRHGSVRVDIETDHYMIEAGLDRRRSSLDSVQQALFFVNLNPDKKPMVIIYDTDEQESGIEFQIRTVVQGLGIAYLNIPTKLLDDELCP